MNSASVATLSFEVIGPNQLITKDRGVYVDDEILDRSMYNVYVDEAAHVTRDDIQLVPPQFYRYLVQRGNSVNEIQFSEDAYEREIAPKLTQVMRDSLFTYQKKAIFQMVKHGRCLNAASMGIGKSIQALAAIACKANPARGDVIICPGYLRANWANEVETWLGDSYPVHIITKGDKKNIEKSIKTLLYAPGLKIVSYDLAANLFAAMSPAARSRGYFNSVVLDESQFMKETSTKRHKMLNKTIKESRYCWLLSGTPAPNKPKELFAQLSLIDRMTFNDEKAFAKRYCDGHYDRFERWDDRGSSCLRELAFLVTKSVIRIRREDHLTELPSIIRQKVILEPETYSKPFKQMMTQFNTELKEIDNDESAAVRLQSLASQMFAETALIKEAPVLQYLETLVEDKDLEKTVLFCAHHSMFDAISGMLEAHGVQFIGISGKTTMADRPGLIERFLREDAVKIALLTIGSCSTGLNIKPVRNMIFCELTWTPSTLSQCEARINRLGGAKHLSYTYLLCNGTLDDMVFRKLQRKNDCAVDVIDGGHDYGDFSFDEPAAKRVKRE